MPDYVKYRSMLHHLILIDEAIRTGGYPNATTLARDLELSSRTIARKLGFLRDVLLAPIEYDSSRKGYYYSQPNWSLPNLRISQGELLGLAMAQLALHAYRGTPLERYLGAVTGKIMASLPEEVEIEPSGLASIFQFNLGPVAPFDPALWEELARAIRKRHTVRMRYYSLTKDQEVNRVIDPYLLRCYRGDWYLIGRDHRTGHVPMYSLARIRKLTVTKDGYEVPDDFDIDEYLGGTFGVFERKERHNVRIQFTGAVARFIQERVWHPSQKLSKKKDGSVVLSMRLADIEEVGRWVLSWGPDAKALGPKELVGFMKTTTRKTKDLYD
jgi:proteasome accessory factor B